MTDTVLFIGDIHIKFNNFKDLDKLEETILQMNDISFIVVAGDVLDAHEKIHSNLMNRAYKFINILRRIAPVYVLVGNHDYINNQQFLTEHHWMNGMKEWGNTYVVDYPLLIERSGHMFVLVPYVPNGRFVEALDKIPVWKKATCVFAHQEIMNCKMGCINSIKGDEWGAEWPMLVSGHIHDRQYVGKNVLYPGSAINHAFGSNNQGISKLIFENGVMSEDLVDIGLEKKNIIYEKITNIDDITKDKLIPRNKLCLTGELKDIKAFKQTKEYSNLKKKGIKVTFRMSDVGDVIKTGVKVVVPFSVILNEMISNERDIDLEKDFLQIKV
jgi:DNA repair exonuclease SbcCD nuclease subunit